MSKRDAKIVLVTDGEQELVALLDGEDMVLLPRKLLPDVRPGAVDRVSQSLFDAATRTAVARDHGMEYPKRACCEATLDAVVDGTMPAANNCPRCAFIRGWESGRQHERVRRRLLGARDGERAVGIETAVLREVPDEALGSLGAIMGWLVQQPDLDTVWGLLRNLREHEGDLAFEHEGQTLVIERADLRDAAKDERRRRRRRVVE